MIITHMPKKIHKKKISKKKNYVKPLLFLAITVLFIILCISINLHFNPFLKPKSTSPLAVTSVKNTISASDMRNLVNQLVAVEYKQNPKVAMDQLKKMLSNNEIANQCHAITHIIGNNAYLKYKDINKALQYYDEMCGSGYIHGIIEQRFASIKSDFEVYQILPTICAPENLGICFHGVGHGFMWYSSDNLPKALSDCDDLQISYRINNCYDGVFMENFEGDHDVHPTNYINPQNPSYPCNQLDAKYKESCYFYSARYYLALYPTKYMDGFAWCRTQENGYQLTCIKGIGSAMMKQNLNDPNLVAGYCNKTANNDEKVYCIDGLVSYYLTNYYSLNKGIAMCNAIMPEDRQQCLVSTENRKNLFPS